MSYECTVTGEGSTIWTGSAFNCAGNEIALIHRNGRETSGVCNNGAIVARSLSVEGNNYTSQLNVTVTPDTAGRTIECASDNGIRIITSKIPTITGLSLA